MLRTFSKIYGLAGLRVGYALGPEELVTSIGKVRRAFDVSSLAQAAALASLDAPDELARRRRENAEGIVQLERIMREHGLDPPKSVANFLFAEVGEDSRPLFEQLLREGVIVRPTGGFGAPGAIRVTVGTQRRTSSSATRWEACSAAQHRPSPVGQREAAVGEAGEAELRAGHLGWDVFP